jgi:putative redox protein
VPAKPPTVVDLSWTGNLTFSGSSAGKNLILDGDSQAGPSPVQALGFALAGCMAADVVHVLVRGRHPLRGLHAHLTADRAQEDPHRFVSVALVFTVEGAVPADAVERAIALSREKYCSVWHSLARDIAFTVTVEQHE